MDSGCSPWTAAILQAANVARLSSPKSAFIAQATTLVHRRAGGGDHHGPPKVNFWLDPMNTSKWNNFWLDPMNTSKWNNFWLDPMNTSKWKEDHFVIVSLTGWGLLFFGGYKYFTRGKKDSKDEKVGEP